MDQAQWWRGDRLRMLRKERESTQQEVARLLEMDQSLYARFENDRTAPTLEVAVRIAKEFQVSLDWLAGLSDERRPQIRDAGLSEGEMAVLMALRHRDIERFMRHALVEIDRIDQQARDLTSLEQSAGHQSERPISPNDP